jgi:CheY-like chemotaxis protein
MKTLRPDLVVADIQLVKSDKVDALSQLARTSGEVPIVYHTAHSSHSSQPEKSMAKMLDVVEMLIGRDGESFRPSRDVLAEKSARPFIPAGF